MPSENYALFLVAAASADVISIEHWLQSPVVPLLASTTGLAAADLFLPLEWHSPVFSDGPAPAFVLQLQAAKISDLQALQVRLQSSALLSTQRWSTGIFSTRSWPISGCDRPAPRTSRVSFLVRYFSAQLPDAEAFRVAYQASHPAILGNFPAIRNIRCYVPHGNDNSTAIELLNEVVFDDTASLDRALASEVLAALREDSAQLPARGQNAHQVMLRHCLL